MIIYNNNPDDYQLIRLSTSSSYRFSGAVLHYQLDRDDHRQNVTCSLFEHQSRPILLRETTSIHPLNITYKAYLRGEYYFTRSFPSHSSIEIHCDEFDGNPTPLYTLLWSLNEINRTLLNKSLNGRYVISDATWRHRGNEERISQLTSISIEDGLRSLHMFSRKSVQWSTRLSIISIEYLVRRTSNSSSIDFHCSISISSPSFVFSLVRSQFRLCPSACLFTSLHLFHLLFLYSIPSAASEKIINVDLYWRKKKWRNTIQLTIGSAHRWSSSISSFPSVH